MVIGVCAGVAIVVIGGSHRSRQGGVPAEAADDVDCALVKCIALTFDDGPSPYTDRLLQILKDNDAKATFFLIGNKVAANPDGRQAHRRGGHGAGQPHLGTPQHDDDPARGHPRAVQQGQRRDRGGDGSAAEAGPHRGRPDQRRRCWPRRGKQGLADINWDVIPFDWANDANTGATRVHADEPDQAELGGAVPRHLLVDRRPGVPVHPGAARPTATTWSPSARCSASARRAAATAAGTTARRSTNCIDIPPAEIPSLPNTPSPAPMPNIPITDIPEQNSGGPNNGA